MAKYGMKASGYFIGLVFIFLQATGMAQGTTQERLKQMRSTVVEKQDGKDYYIHTIERGQTLYMISKAYGVEVNDLIRENPWVKEGIRADQKLRVPVPGQKPAPAAKSSREKTTVKKDPEKKTTSAAPVDTLAVQELPCGIDSASKKSVYRVALMLPLYLDGVDDIPADKPDPALLDQVKSFRFLPYYEGFLLALDSLKKTGLNVRLYIYDSDKDTARTRQILKKPELKTMDLIIGLLYHANFKMVATFARKNKINLVNPISERIELVTGNPYVFKVQPPVRGQVSVLADYLARSCRDNQIVIVRNAQFKDKEAPERLAKECRERQVSADVVEGRQAALLKFSKEKPNVVIAFSDDPAYALDFMRDMYRMRNEYNLTLIGLPKWGDLEGMETEYLVSLKTHLMAPTFIDRENAGILRFIQQYRARFKADPEALAHQGYDQALFFLTALTRYGTHFGRCLEDMKPGDVNNHFSFTHSQGNGYENRHWDIYKYEDYRLIPVN